MYTDEDLNNAVKQGVFSEEAVAAFRSSHMSLQNSPAVDEENFRLVSGFNDIFVVIACVLLLVSSVWLLGEVYIGLDMGVCAVLSWVLAEFFVLRRNMALPAIILLVAFVGSVFALFIVPIESPTQFNFVLASTFAAAAAYGHWLRFKVPITVAVGTAAGAGIVVSMVLAISPGALAWLEAVVFMCGLITFGLAMYWDSADLTRVTRKADVAFWLHLLSAPLIIHPVFVSLGILDGNESLWSMAVVVALYVLMSSISIVIDRRAFMVSSLVYVLYALSSLLENLGGVGTSLAVTGVFMGSALLLLSAFWQHIRARLVVSLPSAITQKIPAVKVV